MFLHFVNNAFGVLTTITPSSDVNEEALLLVKSDAFMFLIMGAIASILGFYFLVRFIKRTNKHIKSTI